MNEEKNIAKLIKKELLNDFTHKVRNGIFAETSKMMAYNSNKIEGSTLTSEETASLFDTGAILATGEVIYRAKDIEEMNGHFLMFNYALKTMDKKLSEELIKSFHFYLKNGVFEDRANGYVPGEYKKRANIVSDIQTSLPMEVPEKMRELLNTYHDIRNPELSDLMRFHANFEKIHPFQDGNGRTGRMILFRECLRTEIVPIIIKDETKAKYYHALHIAQESGDVNELVLYAVQVQEQYLAQIKKYVITE